MTPPLSPALNTAPRQVIQIGHGEAIRALRFLPDGEHLVSIGDDGSVRAWHARSGTLVRVLAEGEGALHTLDVSACGRWLLYGGPDRGLTVQAWPSGEIAAEFDAFPGGVIAACFSPDGERIAIGHGRFWAEERSLEVWRWREPRRERTFFNRRLVGFEGTRDQVAVLAFSPDGLTLAAGVSNRLHVWGPEWNIAVPAHGFVATALAWSPRGDFLVSSGCDRRVALWRPGAQAPEQEWRFSDFAGGCVSSLAIRPDGGEIVAACDDWLMRIDLASGAREYHYFDPADGGGNRHALTYAPGGDRLAVSIGKDWRIWQDGTRAVASAPARPCAFAKVCMLADGAWRAVTHEGRAVRWGDEIGIFPEPPERYPRPALSADGRWCLIAAWGVAPPLLADLEYRRRHAIALSPAGNYNRSAFTHRWAVLVDTRLHLLIRIDPPTRTTETAIAGGKQVSALAAATAADVVVLGDCEEDRLSLWDLGTLQQRAAFPFRHGIDACFALSADGSRLLAAANDSDDRRVQRLHPMTGAVLESFDPPGRSQIVAMAFAPDGERFATGHDDGRTLLWRIGEPNPLHAWKGDGGRTHALAFSNNGEILASGGESLRLRSTRDGAERARLYLFEGGGWATTDPSGRVSASAGPSRHVATVRDARPEGDTP